MSEGSRKYILTRRTAAVADLSDFSVTSGDLDFEQAQRAGVFKVNCTHQVGIATATEVGLTSNRYPVRIVYTRDLSLFDRERMDTVCGYWRICNASLVSIPFSRKPLATEVPLKNLYKSVPDLNSQLWAAYKSDVAVAKRTNRNPEVDAICERLRPLLSVPNPTPNQYAEISACVDQIIVASNSANCRPYFALLDNVYLWGVPHGMSFGAMDGFDANAVALIESILMIKLNYDRLKRRHESMDEGLLTLSAYSIATMFRYGFHESYEHQEYYTAFVKKSDRVEGEFEITKVVAPRGVPVPDDLAEGTVIDISEVRIKQQVVELSALMVVVSGLMHYLFNHTTGGGVATGALLTVLAMYKYVPLGASYDYQIEMTSVLYEALHPTNKRAIANIFFDKAGVYTHGRSNNSRPYEQFQLDAFTQIRMSPYPAGSHKAFVCLQALRRVLQAGLGPFLPWADQINSCIDMCTAVLNSGVRAHVGSSYYTGEPPQVQPAQIDQYLPELAQYLSVFNKGDTLQLSPHLAEDVARRAAMNWQNLLRDLRAKDVSATHVDLVRQFLQTGGAVHFQFDPEDDSTWARAIEDAKRAQSKIDALFV